MSQPWFDIDKAPPKITDWLQAAGALIAIVAAIIGFAKLFRRDKNREKEIKSLTAIADAQQQNLLNGAAAARRSPKANAGVHDPERRNEGKQCLV